MKRTLLTVFSLFAIILTFSTSAYAADRSPVATASDVVSAISAQTGLPADINALTEAGYLTTTERESLLKHDAISRNTAHRIFLPIFGIYPYPSSYYPNAPACSASLPASYADAYTAAVVTGLASAKDNPATAITVSELNQLITTLRSGKISLPAVDFSSPYTDGIVWDRFTYLGRNSFMAAYPHIPASWLEDFAAQGWTFSFERSKTYFEKSYVGLTDYRNQTIHIVDSDPKVTLHELTHYTSWRAGWNKDIFSSFFKRESSNVASVLKSYSQTNPTEYLAEFTSFYILHADQTSQLRQLAPETTKLAERLISSYTRFLGPTIYI